MKEKGKSLDTNSLNSNNYLELNYSSLTDMPCKKHPSALSSGGICPYCLKDRLVNLVCSECGEQRLSSCSCSDVSSSYRNSSCTGEIGNVGRISFLIENENERKHEVGRSDEGMLFRRTKNGLWKIKKLFSRNKKEKGCGKYGGVDQKIEKRGVSRSRSLCSLRGGGSNDADEGSAYDFQSAKISDVTGGILFSNFESRRSGFIGFSDVDCEPRSSGSRSLWDPENEPRKSGFRGLFNSVDIEQRKSTGLRGVGDGDYQHQHASRLPTKRSKGWSDSTRPHPCDNMESVSELIQDGFVDSENGINSFKGVRKKGGPGQLNRVNSVPNRSIFPVQETEFSTNDDDGKHDDDPAFIDFKIEKLSRSESKRQFSFAARRMSSASFDNQDGILRNESNRFLSSSSVGGSCRRIWNDIELKNGGRGSNNKGWKWVFFRQNSGRRSTSK